MNLLWDRGDATVREMLERLGGTLAYTTVMTVLDRLHGKGQVIRRKEGMAWRYRAAEAREAVLGQKAAALLTDARGEPEPLLMAFLDRADATDPGVLDELERLIQKRRQDHRKGR